MSIMSTWLCDECSFCCVEMSIMSTWLCDECSFCCVEMSIMSTWLCDELFVWLSRDVNHVHLAL